MLPTTPYPHIKIPIIGFEPIQEIANFFPPLKGVASPRNIPPYWDISWRRGFPPSHLPSQAICLGLQQTIIIRLLHNLYGFAP